MNILVLNTEWYLLIRITENWSLSLFLSHKREYRNSVVTKTYFSEYPISIEMQNTLCKGLNSF